MKATNRTIQKQIDCLQHLFKNGRRDRMVLLLSLTYDVTYEEALSMYYSTPPETIVNKEIDVRHVFIDKDRPIIVGGHKRKTEATMMLVEWEKHQTCMSRAHVDQAVERFSFWYNIETNKNHFRALTQVQVEHKLKEELKLLDKNK